MRIPLNYLITKSDHHHYGYTLTAFSLHSLDDKPTRRIVLKGIASSMAIIPNLASTSSPAGAREKRIDGASRRTGDSISSSSTFTPPLLDWRHTYGGDDWDGCYDMAETDDGGFALVGRSRSFSDSGYNGWLVRADSSGEKLWERVFPESFPNAVVRAGDGDIVVAGGKGKFLWLAKIDSDGRDVWSKTVDSFAKAWAIDRASDSGFGLFGRSYEAFQGWGVVKVDEDGTVKWADAYNLSGGSGFTATADGGFAAAVGTGPRERRQGLLIKWDSDGNVELREEYGGDGHDYFSSLTQSSDGGFVLGGRTAPPECDEGQGWIVRVDQDGEEEWAFTSDDLRQITSVVETSNGGFMLSGEPLWLVEIDASGEERWTTMLEGFRAEAATQTADGQFVVGGRTEMGSWEQSPHAHAGDGDFLLIKPEKHETFPNTAELLKRPAFPPTNGEFFSPAVYEASPAKAPPYWDVYEAESGRRLRDTLERRFCPNHDRVEDANAVFNDEEIREIVPYPPLRAALASLYGTVGEPAIDAIKDGQFDAVRLGDVPHDGIACIRLPESGTKAPEIVFNDRHQSYHQSEHHRLLAPVLAHMTLRRNSANTEQEALIGRAIEVLVFGQFLLEWPDLATYRTKASRRNSTGLLARINSRDGDGALRLLTSEENVFPCSAVSLPSFAAGFDWEDDSATPGNATLNRMLEIVTDHSMDDAKFSHETVELLDEHQSVFSPEELVQLGLILRLSLDPTGDDCPVDPGTGGDAVLDPDGCTESTT